MNFEGDADKPITDTIEISTRSLSLGSSIIQIRNISSISVMQRQRSWQYRRRLIVRAGFAFAIAGIALLLLREFGSQMNSAFYFREGLQLIIGVSLLYAMALFIKSQIKKSKYFIVIRMNDSTQFYVGGATEEMTLKGLGELKRMINTELNPGQTMTFNPVTNVLQIGNDNTYAGNDANFN